MRRFLTPREHGTYAQLAFPILSGLILGRPALPAFGLALAVICLGGVALFTALSLWLLQARRARAYFGARPGRHFEGEAGG